MASAETRPRHSRQISRVARGQNAKQHGAESSLVDHDKQTLAFIRRVLCPSKTGSSAPSSSQVGDVTPLDDLLPPLTSSNELDFQLYAILAVVINQFVNSWYNRITLDGEFIDEVVSIIAHCTRGIEQRLKLVDWEDILLDELPALLLAQIDAVAVSINATSDNEIGPEARQIFHSLRPNQALTPPPNTPAHETEQQDNELAWCQLLVSRVLPLVLPPEDLQNPCLHVLVSDILSQLIVYNAVCERASQPWVIWEGVTKLITSLFRPAPAQQASVEDSPQPINRLQQFGLVSSRTFASDPTPQRQPRRIDAVFQLFWTTLYLVSLTWQLLRAVARGLMHDSSLPTRPIRRGETNNTPDKLSVTAEEPDTDSLPLQPSESSDEKRPIASMRLWSCISRLTCLEQRMPWLFGLLSLLQWLALNGPGEVCRAHGAVDRLLSVEIQARLQRPDLLPRLLLAARSALFPHDALAPARQPPTGAEAQQLKRECAATIVDAVPPFARSRFFATHDALAMRSDVERTLDLFSDAYVNRHFIVSALQLCAVRIFPELEEGVVDD